MSDHFDEINTADIALRADKRNDSQNPKQVVDMAGSDEVKAAMSAGQRPVCAIAVTALVIPALRTRVSAVKKLR